VCVYVRESVCVRVCLLESFKFEAHEFKMRMNVNYTENV